MSLLGEPTVKNLQKQAQELRAELFKLNTYFGTKRVGSDKQKSKYGLIRKTRCELARTLTKINILVKGQCPKGGLHYPFQNRSNIMMCKKCRTTLQQSCKAKESNV